MCSLFRMCSLSYQGSEFWAFLLESEVLIYFPVYRHGHNCIGLLLLGKFFQPFIHVKINREQYMNILTHQYDYTPHQ